MEDSSFGRQDATYDRRLDGSALAGALTTVFSVDVTGATLTCLGCSRRTPMAETDLYGDAPASVLRCRGCEAVLLRFGVLGRRWHLDLSGAALLVGAMP